MWEQRESGSTSVRMLWHARVDRPDTYAVAGSEYWGISFVRAADGLLSAEMNGPTFYSATVDGALGDEYWGVELAPHVMVASAGKDTFRGSTVALPTVHGRVLIGERWHRIPEFDGLEDWVAELVDAGTLRIDDGIRAALAGDRTGATDRTWQRRFRRVVGLTSAQVRQLARAQHAYVLLQSGLSPTEAASTAGFSDQAHLTRSLRMIRGQTPAAIVAAHLAR
ncbi:AraC-like DNA-binding protein [Microbacterium sp. ZKA21]|uniref:helix-turn-helix domain-containing protein n=1 Tax=Microbacterium sp. ZKA21 TaxID=3381694 RepID=UPI003D19B81A